MAPLLRSLSTASSSSGSHNGKRLRSNSAGWRKQELIGIPHRIKRSISNKSSKNEGNNSVFMPPHTVQEFDSAKRALEKLVKESNFFPLEAASDDWFGSGSGKLDDDENDSICSSCSLSLGDDSCIHEEKSPRQSSRRQVPTVHEKNVVAGSILGGGGFCEVRLAYIANEKLSISWHQESTKEFPISEAAKSKNASMTKIDEVPEDGQGYLESHIISDNPNGLNASYAMKYLSPTKFLPKQVNDYCPPTAVNKEFERAIADLVTEARFLSMLSHPNIITLHYVSEGKLEENFNCGEKFTFYIHQYGYFLLLDKLHETLSQRINNAFIPAVLPPRSSSSSSESSSKSLWWKKALPSSKSNYQANSDGNECGHDKLSPKHHLANRLSSLKCIASALTHMHQRGIISRDVKSDNIGFHRVFQPQCSCGHRCTQFERCLCYEDIPKLFDFGLCRELKSKLRVEMNSRVDNNGDFESSSTRRARDTFKLTGLTGSRRWMAPEVACCLPYNQKADVYSFGMVLYHVTSLLVPFDGFTSSQLEKEVVIGRHRPDTKLSNFSPHSFSSSKKSNHWTKKRNSNDDEISLKEKNTLLAKKTMPVWPKDLKCLIEECWDHDMNFRPEMFEVENRINSCIQELNEDTVARIGSALRRISIRRSSCDTQGARRPSLFTINKDTEDTIDHITPETCVSINENHERVGGSMVDTMNNRRSKCDDSNHRRPSLFSLDFEDDIHHLDSNDGCATEISKSESSVVTESSRKNPHAN